MSKILLVLSPNAFTSFESAYLLEMWERYFDIEKYCGQAVNPRTIFVSKFIEPWLTDKKNAGAKVAVDNLWEYFEYPSYYTIVNRNWFWYNESLWYKSLGYDSYIPAPSFTHTAFMPINAKRSWRTDLVHKLGTRLDKFLWSYNSEKLLPGDCDKSNPGWQRYFNPDWYNSTEFSFVVESNLVDDSFVTEKTFKPIAFNHPFIVYGPTSVLKHLRENGFETFDNIFNESYDTQANSLDRLEVLINNVDNYAGRDRLTHEKVKHNTQRFFDSELVLRRIYHEIVTPLIEYGEK